MNSTSIPFWIFSTRLWTLLLETLEESSVLALVLGGGTSCTATRFTDSSASRCR